MTTGKQCANRMLEQNIGIPGMLLSIRLQTNLDYFWKVNFFKSATLDKLQITLR